MRLVMAVVVAAGMAAAPASAAPGDEGADPLPPEIDRAFYCSEVMLHGALATADDEQRRAYTRKFQHLLKQAFDLLRARGWDADAVTERHAVYMPEVEADWQAGTLRHSLTDCDAVETPEPGAAAGGD